MISSEDSTLVTRCFSRSEEIVGTLHEVTKAFGTVTALREVTLALRKGSVTACVGPNGAGKTTMVRLFLGLLRPSAGDVSVFGMDPTQDGFSRRGDFGVLLENHGLYESLPVAYNLELYARLYGLPSGRRRRMIEDALSLVGMSESVGKKVRQLSKGMKQRVALARAILTDPELLFLDEPTSGLDPEGAEMILDLLGQIVQQREMTILVTSHNLPEIERFCSDVVFLRNGSILEHGTLSELRRRYAKPTGYFRFASSEDYRKAMEVFRTTNLPVVESDPSGLTHVAAYSFGSGESSHITEALGRSGVFPTEVRVQESSLLEMYKRIMSMDQ